MKKKKDDVLFENDILKLLKPIFEQEPGQAEPAGTGQQPGTAQPAGQAQAAPQQQQPGTQLQTTQQPLPPAEVGRVEKGAEIQYLSTKDMFTSAPPPNSSDWPAEMREKTWMIPLQDGRVAQKLMKLFPTFKQDNRGHGAARYSDNQFRVILRGDLTAEIEMKATASTRSPGTTKVELVSVEIPNKASNLVPSGTNPQSVENMKSKGSIQLAMPTEELVKWATGKSTKEKLGNVRKYAEEMMDQVYASASSTIQDAINRSDSRVEDAVDRLATDINTRKKSANKIDDYKYLFKVLLDLSGEEEDMPDKEEVRDAVDKVDVDTPEAPEEGELEKEPEAPKEKKSIKVTDHPSYQNFYDTATGESLGMKKKEAAEYLDWLIKNKKPPLKKMSAQDAAKFVLSNLQAYKDRDEKQESVDLSSYLKRLLLEAEKKTRHGEKELGTKEGGQLIATLNDRIFREWFEKDGAGIAAPTNSRLFEGNMFEWFAASSATFRPKERDVKGVGDEAEITFRGDLIMQSEIWIDSRVEPKGGSSKWSFRAWDKPGPILSSSFRIPVTVQRVAGAVKRGVVEPAKREAAKASSEKEASQGDTI